MVSDGCTNCYAMRAAWRMRHAERYAGLTRMAEHGAVWTGKIRLVPEALDEPLRWRKPCRVFVNSMSDLFHEDVPFDFLDRVFAVMAINARHTFQVLTKRPERMEDYVHEVYAGRMYDIAGEYSPQGDTRIMASFANEMPNVHLGVSVENQATADERTPILLQTPAAVRFLSVEPLLEKIDLSDWLEGFQPLAPDLSRNPSPIDWVIVGGESGPESNAARPCDLGWIRSILEQCKGASVPVFVKQLGSFSIGVWGEATGPCVRDGHWSLRDHKGMAEFPQDLRVREYPR